MPKLSVKKTKSKFGNKIVIFESIKFHSKLECEHFILLRDIFGTKNIRRQFRMDFRYNKKHIFYILLDFVVTLPNGNKLYIDSKGIFTPVCKLKYKLIDEYHGVKILLFTKSDKSKHSDNYKIRSYFPVLPNPPSKRSPSSSP